MLLDFRKAFNLIDHNVLVRKLPSYDIPRRILCWIVDVLLDRKLGVTHDCYSVWRSVSGAKLSALLFLIMINDLDTPADMWKCVDDTSISETVEKGCDSNLQRVVDDLSRQWSNEGFQLNEAKCKELRISFTNNNLTFNPILLNGKPLEEMPSAKLLGLNISSDLRWNVHVLELGKKASCRLYFLRQLKRSQVKTEELMLFYIHAFVLFLNMHVPCSIALSRATSARTWRDCKIVHCELFTPVCHTIRP